MKFDFLGIQAKTQLGEQLVATVGGTISLVCICAISFRVLGYDGSVAVVPSIGAATVLLFAVPHGPLSQPWALFAGNLLSAAVGVLCAMLIPNQIIAAGLAVGLAIGVMHVARCMHPPGGATALAAVLGGASIQELGFYYLIYPVLLNCLIIFIVALVFNNIFGWRRYPAATMQYRPLDRVRHVPYLSSQQIAQAISQTGGIVDVTPKQLEQIYNTAMKIRSQAFINNIDLVMGGVYTNNKPGAQWGIRKIIDYAHHPNPDKELVIYKVLDGARKNSTGSCSKAEFAEWAAQRLKPLA